MFRKQIEFKKSFYKKGNMQFFSADPMPPKKNEKTALKSRSYSASNFFSVLARLPDRPKNRNPVPPKAP